MEMQSSPSDQDGTAINLHAAKTHLSRLVDRSLAGEDIIIARAGEPLVRLVPIGKRKPERPMGLDAGLGRIDDDFEAPLPDDFMTHFTPDAG